MDFQRHVLKYTLPLRKRTDAMGFKKKNWGISRMEEFFLRKTSSLAEMFVLDVLGFFPKL